MMKGRNGRLAKRRRAKGKRALDPVCWMWLRFLRWYNFRKVKFPMNNEPKPGMGFLPTRGRLEIVPNPAPVPVVNNYNFYIDPKAMTALRDALFWAVMIVIVLAFAPKLLRG